MDSLDDNLLDYADLFEDRERMEDVTEELFYSGNSDNLDKGDKDSKVIPLIKEDLGNLDNLDIF